MLALASCFGPVGPVVGDWRGQEPSLAVSYQTSIELILDGPPGARDGTYHYSSFTLGTVLQVSPRRLDWTDQWHMRPVVIGGQSMELVHLDRLFGGRIDDYLLTPQNIMVPQPNPAKPDLSHYAYRVALYPVSPGTFGYGRP